MKPLFQSCLAVAILVLANAAAAPPAPAAMARQPSGADAVALVHRGAAFLHTHSKAEMIRKINARDPEFVRGALYLAMRDLHGVTLAHPNKEPIGKNLLQVPDVDGKLFRREMLAVARSGHAGWVEYKFRNPETGKIEPKRTYVMRVGEVVLEAGVYRHQ